MASKTYSRTQTHPDPVVIVVVVVRVAANWPVGRPFPARELRNPDGFAGVDGAFRFGRDGIAERALEVREVNATGTTVVSPAPRNFN